MTEPAESNCVDHDGFVRYHATVSLPFVVRDEDAERVLKGLHALLVQNARWCAGVAGALGGTPMVDIHIAQGGEAS